MEKPLVSLWDRWHAGATRRHEWAILLGVKPAYSQRKSDTKDSLTSGNAGQGNQATTRTGAVEVRVHDHKASHRIRIVVADDFPAMLDTVETCLVPDCEITERASDGLALVECVRRSRPDLLITDISMPNLNGIEALRQLRSLGVQIPAVILTLNEDRNVAKEAFNAGAQAFVLKSRVGSDLRVAIQEALAGRTYTSQPSTQLTRRSVPLR